MKEEEKLQNQLVDIINDYLETNVTAPAIETIKKDVFVINRLGSILIALQYSSELVRQKGIDFDKQHLKQLSRDEIEKRIEVFEKFIHSSSGVSQDNQEEAHNFLRTDSSNKHLLTYLIRELNWVNISILSASYLSAHVLLRSSFELLIGIATKVTGPMAEKIESIKFFSQEEQKIVKKLWRKLCGWGHPYKKWEKEVCTIFYAHGPLYHPKLCKECIEKFEILIGIFLIVSLDKFEVSISDLQKKINHFGVDFSEFPILGNRL
ncbi:MAG: hypothetical protein GXO85_02000 [Chlorobi bacterium]|nr:hypothetical protein [Chlorobiota bacterium]